MVARNRASTVSVQPKSSASFQDLISAANLGLDRDPTRPVGLFDGAQRNSAANLRAGIEGMEYLESGGNSGNRDPYGSSAPHFGMGSSTQLRGYKDDGLSGSARPRATTISMLDQPSARLGNVGMHGSELMDSLIAPSAPTPPPMGMGSGLISANQGGRRSALGNDDQARRRDRVEGARTGPGGASGDGMAAGQTPTRSIWLGNLDVMTTAQDLLQVFQGYGDIESLRLLPEKVSRVLQPKKGGRSATDVSEPCSPSLARSSTSLIETTPSAPRKTFNSVCTTLSLRCPTRPFGSDSERSIRYLPRSRRPQPNNTH
jgi:protein JSN1